MLACGGGRPAPAPVPKVLPPPPAVDHEADELRKTGTRVESFERDGERWWRGSALVHANVGQVRRTVLDYGKYSQFIHPFSKSVVVARNGLGADVYLKVVLYDGKVTLWTIQRFAPPTIDGRSELIVATMQDGNVSDARAFWRYRPVADGTTVLTLELIVRPAWALPTKLVDDHVRALTREGIYGASSEAERRAITPHHPPHP